VSRVARTLVAVALSGAAIGASIAPARIALAAPPEDSDAVKKAREEFRRGLALEAAGDYEGALTVYKSVALVKSTPAVRYHIAVCEENTGDWIGALGSYRLAAADAVEAKVPDVAAESNAAITKLEPRVPKLTIKRGDGAVSATILLDGKELGSASVGTSMSVNPGPHRIEGAAPNKKPTRREITAVDGKSDEITIALEDMPAAQIREPTPTSPTPDVKKTPSGLLPAGAVIVALGGAGLVTSGVFFGLRASAISDLDAACGADQQSCPESLRSTAENGATYSTVAMATLIGGASAVGIGSILLIVEAARKPSVKKPTASVDVRVLSGAWGPEPLSVGPTGLSFAGRF
jgi:hypothetical protein